MIKLREYSKEEVCERIKNNKVLFITLNSFEKRSTAAFRTIENSVIQSKPAVDILIMNIGNTARNHNVILEIAKEQNRNYIKEHTNPNSLSNFDFSYPLIDQQEMNNFHTQINKLIQDKAISLIIFDFSCIPRKLLFYITNTLCDILKYNSRVELIYSYSLPEEYVGRPLEGVGILKDINTGESLRDILVNKDKCMLIDAPSISGSESPLLIELIEKRLISSGIDLFLPLLSDHLHTSLQVLQNNVNIISFALNKSGKIFYPTSIIYAINEWITNLEERLSNSETKTVILIGPFNIKPFLVCSILYLNSKSNNNVKINSNVKILQWSQPISNTIYSNGILKTYFFGLDKKNLVSDVS